MHQLLASSEPYDPISRAETAFDYWAVRSGELLDDNCFQGAFDIVLCATLAHDAFSWNDQGSRSHLRSEPIGLCCSPLGGAKLIEMVFLFMWEEDLVGSPGSHLDAVGYKTGPNYLAAVRLGRWLREADENDARLRRAEAMVHTIAVALNRSKLSIAA
jgi:hypothetical protein